ncbi:hypothetical protein GALMADRAFT_918782 [Galerina marginata CBS 339.88]|uniref:Uncharacterized protein n=1 Tax=Galerina marginata (strain CBS 339.88) TaxID=685588 RepID=A0A067SFH8_GALM3|nr:hypothetical protein GALMADRAFT_918782 [Galerina marginata CBS 339.88]
MLTDKRGSPLHNPSLLAFSFCAFCLLFLDCCFPRKIFFTPSQLRSPLFLIDHLFPHFIMQCVSGSNPHIYGFRALALL